MKVIQPNCRAALESRDIDFLVSVLTHAKQEERCLVGLLEDREIRDSILDNKLLIQAIRDPARREEISSTLYFYIIVRDCFLRQGIDSRELADYVADMLAVFCNHERWLKPVMKEDKAFDYLVGLWEAAYACSRRDRSFAIQCHVGNFALFLSGLFAQRIREREDQGPVFRGIEYFESLGAAGFRAASAQHLASEFELVSILEEMATRFHSVRLALNEIAEAWMFAPNPSEVAA